MSEGDPLPRLNRWQGLALGSALLLAMAAVACLRDSNHFPTGFFETDSGVVGARFQLQLGVLILGVAALQLAPVSWSRAIVCVEGTLCLLLISPALGAAFLATLVAFYYALELPLPRLLRVLLPVAWILGVGVAAPRLEGGRWNADAFLFSILFHFRMLVYAWEKWQSGFPRARLGDYLLYMLSPPLIVFPPYIGIIPFFGKNAERFAPRLDRARAWAGIRQIAVGLAFVLLLEGMRRAQNWSWNGLDIRKDPWSRMYWLLARDMVTLAQLVYVVYGLLLLHGFVDRIPIDRPFLSRTYVEFWRRFQIHQKDVQVAFFFNPVMLKLRKFNRYFAIAAAAALTMLVGNFCLHYLVRYAYSWRLFEHRIPAWIWFDVASFVGLTVNLWTAEWRARTHRPAPTGGAGVFYGILSWVLTMTFASYLWSL